MKKKISRPNLGPGPRQAFITTHLHYTLRKLDIPDYIGIFERGSFCLKDISHNFYIYFYYEFYPFTYIRWLLVSGANLGLLLKMCIVRPHLKLHWLLFGSFKIIQIFMESSEKTYGQRRADIGKCTLMEVAKWASFLLRCSGRSSHATPIYYYMPIVYMSLLLPRFLI